MTTKTALLGKAFIVALPFCALAVVPSDAAAQELAPPPPPATYVATVAPVYYNGVPTYWYRDHWYWRSPRGTWSYYRVEPRFLQERRMHTVPVRHFEEHRYEHRR